MNLLSIQNLTVRYPRPGGQLLEALKTVSLHVEAGESMGIVGESGSGKSTLAKAIVGLVRPHSGQILYEGVELSRRTHAEREACCRRVQMVFQDAIGSLNPRMTVAAMLEEVLRVHRITNSEESLGTRKDSAFASEVLHLLDQVGLPPEVARAYPRELSGGQCQRGGDPESPRHVMQFGVFLVIRTRCQRLRFQCHTALGAIAGMVLLVSACAWAQQPRYLENSRMRLSFDSKSGTLKTMENKLTAEIYGICGDEWEVEAVEFQAKSADLKLASLSCQGEVVTARYASDRIIVEVTYTLHGENHFVEKRAIGSSRSVGCQIGEVKTSEP